MGTSIGTILQKIRYKNNELLHDMANNLNVATPYLSSIENGKIPSTEEFITSVLKFYDLDLNVIEELIAAYKFTNANEIEKEDILDQFKISFNESRVLSFIRRDLDDYLNEDRTPEEIAQFLEIKLNSLMSENVHMGNEVIEVTPNIIFANKIEMSHYLNDMTEMSYLVDEEVAHLNADRLLCHLLIQLGYGELIDIYEKIKKSYT